MSGGASTAASRRVSFLPGIATPITTITEARESSMQRPKVQVTMSVFHSPKAGEELMVCGSIPEFGEWNPNLAMKLSTSRAMYPKWTAQLALEEKTHITYKYIVKGPNGVYEWETLPDNRSFDVMGRAMVVKDGVLDDPYSATRHGRIDVKWEGADETGMDYAQMSTSVPIVQDSPPRSNQTVFNCSLRLPLKAKEVHGEYEYELDYDNLYGMARGLYSLPDHYTVVWLGTLDIDVPQHRQEQVRNEIRKRFNMVPIFVPQEVADQHYQYCKQVLWPVLYSISYSSSHPWNMNLHPPDLWQSYITLNLAFAQAVVPEFVDGALIWVHDYHLLLLPSNIRKKIPSSKIGIFLHTPFPSSDLFRILPMRKRLLHGMLSASLVGFHLFDYARHFLSCCVRMLSLEYHSRRGGVLWLEYNSRRVNVRVSHVGVDSDFLKEAGGSPECRTATDEMRKRFSDVDLILGLSPLDYVKGIPLKIKAFRRYLERFPEYKRKVVLFLALSPRRVDDPNAALTLKKEITDLAEAVNKDFGTSEWTPVVLDWGHFPIQRRIACYKVSRVWLSTAIRDGLDLTTYEYIFADSPKSKGVVVSEFSGCSRAISALRCNPFDADEVASAIHAVMTTPKELSDEAHEKDINIVQQHAISKWAKSFVGDLQLVSERDNKLTTKGLNFELTYDLSDLSGSGLRQLNTEDVLRAYRRASHRLLLFDYEGTMITTNKQGGHAASTPTDTVLSYLRILAADPKNKLYILSGKRKSILEGWFGGVKDLGLAAEHGFFFRPATTSLERPRVLSLESQQQQSYQNQPPPTQHKSQNPNDNNQPTPAQGAPNAPSQQQPNDVPIFSSIPSTSAPVMSIDGAVFASTERKYSDTPHLGHIGRGSSGNLQPIKWQRMFPNADLTWIKTAQVVMDLYSERIEGSYTEYKESSVVWHFGEADREFASDQANELRTQLNQILGNFPIKVVMGSTLVEVRSAGINKGATVEKIIAQATHPFDLVLCAGDDRSDEDMFSSLNACFPGHTADLPASAIMYARQVPRVFSVTVGKKPSHARFYLSSATEVNELLQMMALATSRSSRSVSMLDMQSLGANRRSSAADIPSAMMGAPNSNMVGQGVSRCGTSSPLVPENFHDMFHEELARRGIEVRPGKSTAKK